MISTAAASLLSNISHFSCQVELPVANGWPNSSMGELSVSSVKAEMGHRLWIGRLVQVDPFDEALLR